MIGLNFFQNYFVFVRKIGTFAKIFSGMGKVLMCRADKFFDRFV